MNMGIDCDGLKKARWFAAYPEEIKRSLDAGYVLPEIPAHWGLKSSAKYYPATTALVYEPENFIVNYAEFQELCERFASGLQNKMGVIKGDMVAVYARNCPEVAVAIMAISMIGAVYVGCNALLIKDEVAYQLNDTEAKTVIVSDELLPAIRDLVDEKKTVIKSVIVFFQDQELKLSLLKKEPPVYQSPFYGFCDILSDDSLIEPTIDPKKDLFAILYTSGTTSYPKGVMISHYNVVSACIIYGSTYTGQFPVQDADGLLKFTNHEKDLSMNWDFPLRHGIDWILSVPPWTHMMGFLGRLMYPLMSALPLIHLPVFNMDSMLEMIQRYKISFSGGAPMMLSTILSRPDIETQDISCIRTWAVGGSTVPEAVTEKFEKRISGVISEAWALTEGTMTSTKHFANRSGLKKSGSVGVPVPFTWIKVVDPVDGVTEMPVGEEGELIQKGPTVTQGYFGKPKDTANAYRDGWLYTGDIGKMDEDGFFYITGRKKELIKYKGYNIAPSMLENVLFDHSDVKHCVVLGKKDPVVGELPIAFVQLKSDATATADEIMNFVNSRVAPYKKIREVIFLEELPMLASGKANRLKLYDFLSNATGVNDRRMDL
jgi:long-chain acyl-CoA synthetase